MSSTYTILEVSPAVYDEVHAKLQAAAYDHALHETPDHSVVLDLHGIALARVPDAGRPVRVRSKLSGKEGTVLLDDPQVWVEGAGIAGWYRRETLLRDFLILEE